MSQYPTLQLRPHGTSKSLTIIHYPEQLNITELGKRGGVSSVTIASGQLPQLIAFLQGVRS